MNTRRLCRGNEWEEKLKQRVKEERTYKDNHGEPSYITEIAGEASSA